MIFTPCFFLNLNFALVDFLPSLFSNFIIIDQKAQKCPSLCFFLKPYMKTEMGFFRRLLDVLKYSSGPPFGYYGEDSVIR